jgi:hypothetical protein
MRPSKTNCWIWAIRLFIRRKNKAKRRYFLVRWSDCGWMPHLLYCELRPYNKHRVISLKPIGGTAPTKIPEVLFHGEIKWGDKFKYEL